MASERNHLIHLSDKDVAALERSVRTRHGVLGLTGDMRATDQVQTEADLLAHVAAIVQEHTRPDCGCFPAPVPPPLRPRPVIPIQERKVI